ncbi:DEAD/DEAH box helicase, partial [Litorivivens sp.]
MVDDSLKQQIQTAYSTFLSSKGLKPRYGQRLMIAHVARTLSAIECDDAGQRTGGKPLVVVEAGTGTGKTLAYLVAALPIARARNKTLVISTATVALQEQILLRDIPDIIEHSGLDFDFALAKGRQRYLCHARLDQQLSGGGQNQLLYPDEIAAQPEAQVLHLYQNMADALARNQWDGDRDQWPDAIDDESWLRLTTEPAQCTGRRCSFIRECTFFKARENLQDVDVVVANHDLVLADLALGGGAILPPPEDAIYVFDEAHHLPDKVINHFSFQLRFHATERWLDQTLRAVRGMAEQIGQGELRSLIDALAGHMAVLLEVSREASPLVESLVQEG